MSKKHFARVPGLWMESVSWWLSETLGSSTPVLPHLTGQRPSEDRGRMRATPEVNDLECDIALE